MQKIDFIDTEFLSPNQRQFANDMDHEPILKACLKENFFIFQVINWLIISFQILNIYLSEFKGTGLSKEVVF